MTPNRVMQSQAAGALMDHLTRDTRKTVLAVGLLALMAFMWVRVLIGRKPVAAGAAPPSEQNAAGVEETSVTFRPVDLPQIPGRTDTIHTDFFVIHDRAPFQTEVSRDAGTATEVQNRSQDRTEEVIRRIAQKLRVEAVLRTDDPQVYIRDRFLDVGQTLVVKEGAESFEFEVREIQADAEAVIVECRGLRLTLKLAQSLEVGN